jgi:hypothetical protein
VNRKLIKNRGGNSFKPAFAKVNPMPHMIGTDNANPKSLTVRRNMQIFQSYSTFEVLMTPNCTEITFIGCQVKKILIRIMPSGLFISEATFAMNLLKETPADAVSLPVRLYIFFLIS